MPGIYDVKGNFIAFNEGPDRKALLSEIATAAAVGEMDLGGMLASLPDPDPVLRKRGDDAQVLEDLTADDQVCTAMLNRKLRVLNNHDYAYKPGVLPEKKASAPAKKLCDDLSKDLEGIKLKTVFDGVLESPFYGSSFLELMWEPDGGRLRLVDIVAKPRKWFTFDKTGRPCLKPSQGGEPKPLPPGKFLIPRHFPTYENPYGLRLLSRCLWPVTFKRGGAKFFAIFVERYGMPWALAHAEKNATTDDKRNMAADLASMVQDAVAVVSHGAQVELLESKGKAGDLHEMFLRRWDKAITKVLGGQTLTTEMDGQGSRAAAETHYKVADDISEADQNLVVDAMNDLGLTYRNVNAANTEAPVFAYHEPEDYQAQAELDGKLHTVGVRFKPAHFERRYGLREGEYTLVAEPGTPDEKGDPEGGGPKKSEFSENRPPEQSALDQLVAGILPEAASQNENFVNELVDLLERAESWEEMQILLAEHLGSEMGQDEQERILADLMAAAGLMGRTHVADEG